MRRSRLRHPNTASRRQIPDTSPEELGRAPRCTCDHSPFPLNGCPFMLRISPTNHQGRTTRVSRSARPTSTSSQCSRGPLAMGPSVTSAHGGGTATNQSPLGGTRLSLLLTTSPSTRLDESQDVVDGCDAFAVAVGAVVVRVEQERRETRRTGTEYIVVERVAHVRNSIAGNAFERR